MKTLESLKGFAIKKQKMTILNGGGRYYYCITYWKGGESSGGMVEDIYSGHARDKVVQAYREQNVVEEVDHVYCI